MIHILYYWHIDIHITSYPSSHSLSHVLYHQSSFLTAIRLRRTTTRLARRPSLLRRLTTRWKPREPLKPRSSQRSHTSFHIQFIISIHIKKMKIWFLTCSSSRRMHWRRIKLPSHARRCIARRSRRPTTSWRATTERRCHTSWADSSIMVRHSTSIRSCIILVMIRRWWFDYIIYIYDLMIGWSSVESVRIHMIRNDIKKYIHVLDSSPALHLKESKVCWFIIYMTYCWDRIVAYGHSGEDQQRRGHRSHC